MTKYNQSNYNISIKMFKEAAPRQKSFKIKHLTLYTFHNLG